MRREINVPLFIIGTAVITTVQRLYYQRKISKINDLHTEEKIQENMRGWRRGWNDGLDHADSMVGYTGQFKSAKTN